MTTYIPQLKTWVYFKQTVLPCVMLFVVVGLPVLLLHYYMEEGWGRFVLSIFLTVFLTSLINYKFLIEKDLRKKVLLKIKMKFGLLKKL